MRKWFAETCDLPEAFVIGYQTGELERMFSRLQKIVEDEIKDAGGKPIADSIEKYYNTGPMGHPFRAQLAVRIQGEFPDKEDADGQNRNA